MNNKIATRLGTAALVAVPFLAHASDCDSVPASGKASVTAKYMKIDFPADRAGKCIASRARGIGGNVIRLVCDVHFRPRNGGCYVGYSNATESGSLSRHPGCDAGKWAWVNHVELGQAGSSVNANRAEKPQGRQFDASVRFDMMRAHYEVKYIFEVGDQYQEKPAYAYYHARVKQVCLRSY